MENRKILTAVIYDPGQDAKVNLMRVPDDHTYTIEKVYAVADRTLAGATDNYFSVNLANGGTAGTGTDTIGSTAGGTEGWTANTPKEITITSGSGDLTAGQWLVANYAETGSVAPGVISLSIEYVDGIGSTA